MPRYTRPRRTWKYSKEFKLKAVKLTLQEDSHIKDVALGLDIHPFMLSRWRREYREGLLGRVSQKNLDVIKKQKTSNHSFQRLLKRHGFKHSLNRPGHCTDNAFMESFYHSLKGELIRGTIYKGFHALRKDLGRYINKFYNAVRLHSGLSYQSPVEFERGLA